MKKALHHQTVDKLAPPRTWLQRSDYEQLPEDFPQMSATTTDINMVATLRVFWVARDFVKLCSGENGGYEIWQFQLDPTNYDYGEWIQYCEAMTLDIARMRMAELVGLIMLNLCQWRIGYLEFLEDERRVLPTAEI